MKKLILTTVAFAAIVLPVSPADASPKHHHDAPIVQRAIDWD